MGPYAEAAWTYRAAGWAGVLPLPAGAKKPAPAGYTGWAGVEPSGADVQAWVEGERTALGNIALRLPAGVYGLDVDDYGAKTGGTALAGLVERLGPLPATWTTTSREASSSGIRLFRAAPPLGTRWRDEPAGHGAGIEAIHVGHRYAVVWPSIHPDTGAKYFWRRPDGIVAGDGEVPCPADLAELPQAWIFGLVEVGEVRLGEMAGHDETVRAVTGWREGDACPRVGAAWARAHGALRAAADGSALHPAALSALHELTNLGHEGHAGVRRALAEHYSIFVEVRAGRGGGGARADAEREWWRMVRGAVGKLLTGGAHEVCDCGLRSGEGLTFDPVAEGVWSSGHGPGNSDNYGEVRGPRPQVPTGEYPPGREANGLTLDAPDLADLMLGQMLTSAQMAQRDPPAPLVAGLLFRNTLAWLIGKSGSFKSFVALDLAQAVGLGRPWAGRAAHAGPVVYLLAEGAGGMTLRVRAWAALHGPASEAVHFLPRPVQVNGEGWAVFVEAARRLGPVLIVIDTQARVSVGIRENDNTEMGAFIERVDALRVATGACVLLVHHIGRQGDDARGASAIDGAQDTELKVERVGGPKALTARLVVDKQKDGADTASVDFEMIPIDLGIVDENGEPITSLALSTNVFLNPLVAPWRDGLAENQGMIIDIMIEMFSERGGTRAEIAAALRERGQRGSLKYVKSSFHAAWNQLLKRDRLAVVSGTQRYVVMVDEDR